MATPLAPPRGSLGAAGKCFRSERLVDPGVRVVVVVGGRWVDIDVPRSERGISIQSRQLDV